MEKPTDLIFVIEKMTPYPKSGEVSFTIAIMDEKTLQWMERAYPNKLKFDGGRTFYMEVLMPIKNMVEEAPQMWAKLLKERPDIVQQHVLKRLKGEI